MQHNTSPNNSNKKLPLKDRILQAKAMTYLTKGSIYLGKGTFWLGVVFVITNQTIDLFTKGRDEYKKYSNKQSYVPDGIGDIPVEYTTEFQSIFTKSVSDVVKAKGGYDSIPDIISYKKNNINISNYIDSLENIDIQLLDERGTEKKDRVEGLVKYLQRDFAIHQCLLEEVSSQRIGITAQDSYRDKVAKIQKFVRSLKYERDLLYLGKDKNLPVFSNYQLPSVANLIVGKMDCNNKAGLFVQLCWINDILVGVGASKNHMAPIVYTPNGDDLRNNITENASANHTLNGIVVDPSNTDVSGGISRPGIPGDMLGEQYKGMEFVLAKNPFDRIK